MPLLHGTDDAFELYVLKLLEEPYLGELEEHLLICEECQAALEAVETYIAALRLALRNHSLIDAKVKAAIAKVKVGNVITFARKKHQ